MARTRTITESVIEEQVPRGRRAEIRKYLELFGYKPDRSILQVHIAGYFGRGITKPTEIAARERAAARYGGRTFTIVGRTHDPDFLARLIPPRRKQPESSSGYVGYLFKPKDEGGRAPDELLPLDFVPVGLPYPKEWKDILGTRGYLVTLHVPSNFARKKNELNRRLRRIGAEVNVKKEWKFLDEIEEYGYNAVRSQP